MSQPQQENIVTEYAGFATGIDVRLKYRNDRLEKGTRLVTTRVTKIALNMSAYTEIRV